MSALLEVIAQAIFELAGYLTAWVLLPVATFGYVRTQWPAETFTFRWHGFKRLPDGTIVVQHETACVIGCVFLLVCVIASVLIWKGPGGEAPECTRPAISAEAPPAAPRSASC